MSRKEPQPLPLVLREGSRTQDGRNPLVNVVRQPAPPPPPPPPKAKP
ncbi:MAG: hypothetical protein LBU17_11275 [Treponema sp.]|nr:hypothetical protein [Treponema sp.]